MSSPNVPRRGSGLWLWVAGPDYYLDADGHDRRGLEPDIGFVPQGWWTCAPATKAGDLVFLYRSKRRKDIAHFLVARSDAEVLDLPQSPFHGKTVCQYEVIAKFNRPATFATISADPVLQDWAAVKLRFVKSYFPIPDREWVRLLELLGEDRDSLEQQAVDGLKRIRLESQIQQWLADYPGQLAEHGLRGLRFKQKEFFFPRGGRADLVYTQGAGLLRRYVVLELKRDQVGPRAVEQVLRYKRLLDDQRPGPRTTHAVLIGTHAHNDAIPLMRRARIRFISLTDLKMTRTKKNDAISSPPSGGDLEKAEPAD
jgi:hypothetical protein